MDRSYLSQPDVIAASRNFICVRMMTYESADEAQVLKALWRPDAELENTVFAILDPYGRQIFRGARGPRMLFMDSHQMAYTMNDIARYYKSGPAQPQGLPIVDTVRLGLNVAACDKLPLAIVVSDNEQDRKKLANTLSSVAWNDHLIGKLVYSSGNRHDLRDVHGASIASGYIFVSPNLFGTEGTATVQVDASASPVDLERAAMRAISWHRPQFAEHHDHVMMGRQQGLEWKSAIPVTDRQALQAQHGGPGGYGRDGFR